MPRPTPAQFAYGSVTVVCSTLAMLLLSGSPSGTGVAVIAVVALVLGLLVALSVPATRPARRTRTNSARSAAATARGWSSSRRQPASGSRIQARHDTATRSAAQASAAGRRPGRRVAEASLRR